MACHIASKTYLIVALGVLGALGCDIDSAFECVNCGSTPKPLAELEKTLRAPRDCSALNYPSGIGGYPSVNGRGFDFPCQNRDYWVVVPPDFDNRSPKPLILVLPGWRSNGYDIATRYRGDTAGADVIGVFPNGFEYATRGLPNDCRAWNGGGAGCCSGGNYNWAVCSNDVAFIGSLLIALLKEFCVDNSKIYLSGISNGAMMVYDLPGEFPGVFAGIAPIVGTPHPGFFRNPGNNPPAIMHIAGNRDQVVPIDGSPSRGRRFRHETPFFTVREYANQIASTGSGCPVLSNPVNYGQSVDFGLRCETYTEPSCATPGKDAVLCIYNGGHPDRPSGTMRLILQFLTQYTNAYTSSPPPQEESSESSLPPSSSQGFFLARLKSFVTSKGD